MQAVWCQCRCTLRRYAAYLHQFPTVTIIYTKQDKLTSGPFARMLKQSET